MCLTYPLNLIKNILLLFFISCLSQNLHAGSLQDTIIAKQTMLSDEELVRGERLFHGLVYTGNPSMKCTGCHNVRHTDTLNWNPDAIEISKKYLNLTADDLAKVLLKPQGKKMAESHKGIKLSPEEIALIKAHMDELAHQKLIPEKTSITNLLIFIVSFILLLFSLTDMVVVKKLSFRIDLAIFSLTGIIITYYLVVEGINVGHSPKYEPDQPVKFSHLVHAGQNRIDCIYCHSDAPFSKQAGITPENVCMNCHLLVRNGTRSGTFEIAKVINAYDKKIPISWTRVYNLPDHVYFNHSQHVTAGGIKCQTCHGEVQDMNRIQLSRKLTMGWCINCHRRTAVNFRGNIFYTQYSDLNRRIREGQANADSITIEQLGGVECMKCHY
jgi:hypothetical protein